MDIPAAVDPASALADRLLDATLGALDVLSVHLGDRLGHYRALAELGGATPTDLARHTGTHPRYALEWCRQQAATGFLLEGPAGSYRLADGAAEVLTDEHSLLFTAPVARLVAGLAVHTPALLAAYRSGGGVSWASFGTDVREAQADANRPWFEHALAPAIERTPVLVGLLEGSPRIADIGCGAAWSSIALARSRPAARVLALDVDAPTVELARDNVARAGLADRVEVHLADAEGLVRLGPFDLVTAFECVHDLPHPVPVLAAARTALAPGGAVLVVDEAVADEPPPPGDPVERLMHGWSLLACLPDSLGHPGSVGTGTVMRPATLARYAHDAGFRSVEDLGVEGSRSSASPSCGPDRSGADDGVADPVQGG